MKKEDLQKLIVYEIYPTSFYDSNNDGIGDLNGIKEKLDYVKELGFNAIWLNPFFTSPFHDGGYDVVDFKNVDSKFGTLDDFNSLLNEAHKKGIKIFIDCVAGHVSEEHPFFIKSGEEERNEYSDMFIWTNNVWNYNSKYKLISGRHPRNGNYLVNFFSFQPALNFGFKDIDDPSWQMSYQDPRTFKAREFVIDFMMFWLSIGVDGFRVDMADSLVKNDEDKSATIEVWKYIFSKVKPLYPNAFFVSEWCNPWQALEAGFDCDFVLDHWDNFYHSFVRADQYSQGPSVLNGASYDFFLTDLKARLDASKMYDGYLGLISGNHDVIRLANYVTEDKAKIYFMLMMFLPGIPFVYYGDEIGMKHVDMKNKDGGYQRVGSRTPMQWDTSKNAGFSSCKDELYLPVFMANKNNVDEQIRNPNSLYHFVNKLIEIRKNNGLLEGKDVEIKESYGLLTFTRNGLELKINLSGDMVLIRDQILLSTGNGNELEPFQAAISKTK